MKALIARNADLAQRLSEAETTIQALLVGEIDGGVDNTSNTPVLLSKAQVAHSEERYRRIVETTREGVWMIDKDHKTTFVNRRMAEMLGCTPDGLLGCSPFAFLDEAEGRKFAAYLERTDGGQVDIRYTRTDGSHVWALLEVASVMDRAGRHEGSLAMVVDITERKQAEIALRYERDRAESYLEAAEVMMLALDMDARITMINRYACSVIGTTAEELLGRDWFATCVPTRFQDALRLKFAESVNAAATPTSGDIIENPIVTKSGEERLFEWRSSVLRDDAGVAIGAITSGTDITARTQALADVLHAEEPMRFAFESAGVGIWDMDFKSGVLRWSTTLERQFGLAPGTFDGTYDSFVALIHPDDREATLDVMGRAAKSGSDFSTQNRTLWPDGTVRSLNGFGRIHHDDNGEPLRGVGISIDVTERQLLESRNRQAQKMDAIGQLASGVAHDFNNLLTVILGFADFVTEDTALNDRSRGDVGEIIKAARRASGLTRQLLAFSRQQVLETAPLDVNALVTDMAAMLRRLIGENIEICLDLGSGLPMALSDRGQLEQVLMNLLVNARDAMPSGGTVTIKTRQVKHHQILRLDEIVIPGDYVLFAVTDTGSGMSRETQRRLFEPFFTTKEIGKGTGLGLSTAYGIVKQSKGYISADSELGRGTTFGVYLPSADLHTENLNLPSAVPSSIAATETVLLVEDEEAVREFSRRCLEREGYRVFVANNGTEAERLFAERRGEIKLVLTDVVMPGCGGPELVTRLRRSSRDLKVLYMSGYTEQSAATDIALQGATVLQKPFTASDLRRRVRQALDRVPQI